MKKKIKKEKKKSKKPKSMPFIFPAGIICGPHRGSFAVRDHLRFDMGIISGMGIICGRGSFEALYIASYSHPLLSTEHASNELVEALLKLT